MKIKFKINDKELKLKNVVMVAPKDIEEDVKNMKATDQMLSFGQSKFNDKFYLLFQTIQKDKIIRFEFEKEIDGYNCAQKIKVFLTECGINLSTEINLYEN